MKVVYTCRHADISDGQKAKLQRKFEKINRILTHGRDLEAHVVLSRERRGCEAEVTLRALHHTLVVSGQNAQAFAAAHIAVDKLVRQAAKNKHKLVDVRRPLRHRDEPKIPVREVMAAQAKAEPEPAAAPSGPVRSHNLAPKPLTLEGAQMALESNGGHQLTYRDADSGRICVLFRGPDGGLQVVETPA
jgi:ribosomal subunit interface protein